MSPEFLSDNTVIVNAIKVISNFLSHQRFELSSTSSKFHFIIQSLCPLELFVQSLFLTAFLITLCIKPRGFGI